MPRDLIYDPYERDTALNPYPVFRRLRDEVPLYYSDQHAFYAPVDDYPLRELI